MPSPRVATIASMALLLGLLPGCRSAEERRLQAARGVYDQYCSGCHGLSESGPAPVTGLAFEPADLRRLHERYGRPLDRAPVAAYIDGRHAGVSEAARAMPVWGKKLYEQFPETVKLDQMRAGTIDLLIDYLDSIQPSEEG